MSYDALLYSNIILWLVVFGMGAILFGMVRQIGVLHERIAPMGALMNDRGPEVGEMAPDMRVHTIDGQTIRLGGASPTKKSRLFLFVSPTCPICKKLLPIAKSFAAGEQLEVVLVGDGDPAEQRAMIAQHALSKMVYVNSPQVGMAFHVGKLPYAVLIDEEGVVRAKGLVNSREHLESLAIARETGYGSIQAYLKARGYIADAPDQAPPAEASNTQTASTRQPA